MGYRALLAQVLALLAGMTAAGSATAAELSTADRAAVFAAAGFKPLGDSYVRCDDSGTDSSMATFTEAADLNGDGSPEVWVRESSTFCYGSTGEAFVLLTRDGSGSWVRLLDVIGVGLPLETSHNGWPDILVGGPGSGPFPVYRFDGTKYVIIE